MSCVIYLKDFYTKSHNFCLISKKCKYQVNIAVKNELFNCAEKLHTHNFIIFRYGNRHQKNEIAYIGRRPLVFHQKIWDYWELANFIWTFLSITMNRLLTSRDYQTSAKRKYDRLCALSRYSITPWITLDIILVAPCSILGIQLYFKIEVTAYRLIVILILDMILK